MSESNANLKLFFFRLIKENICDKSTVPSVSAISRLLRGRDEEEVKKTSRFSTINACSVTRCFVRLRWGI